MKRKPTVKILRCDRCCHSWDWHEHSESPVPKTEPRKEQCLKLDCACRGYVGLGPASLRRSA